MLTALGAQIAVLNLEEKHAELVGTVQISAPAEGLGSTEISGALAAQLIDELPVLAAIAPYTSGGIRIRDAKELRVKESDRIALVAQNLRAMGAEVAEFEDGLDVPGGQTLHGATIDSGGDHRIAMAFSVAGTARRGRHADSGRGIGRHQLPRVLRSAGPGRGAIDRARIQSQALQSPQQTRRPGTWPGLFCCYLLRKTIGSPVERCWFIALLGRLQARNQRRRVHLARGRLVQVDAVVLQGRGQDLVKARAVLGIGGIGRDQIVLRSGQIALLQQHIGSGRSAQPGASSPRRPGSAGYSPGPHRAACTCARSLVSANLRIHHLHANLRVQLLQPQLRLAVFHQRPRLFRPAPAGCGEESKG